MLVCFLVLLAFQAPAQNTGSVEGSVLNSATHAGIGGVSVKLFTREGVRYETSTDASGKFTIVNMKEDEYSSTVERDGFAATEHNGLGPEPRVRVSGKDPGRLDVELIPYAALRGRVVDAEGNPALKASVTLNGPATMGPLPIEDTTDKDGGFMFGKLLPGAYTILAKPKPSAPSVAENRTEAVPTFFPAALERSQAAQIAVRAGADESGYEIRLRRVPVFRIRGVVRHEAGKPAAKVNVGLHARGAIPIDGGGSQLGGTRTYYPPMGPGPAVEQVVTGSDGVFEFSSVYRGDWLLIAESEWVYIEETKRDIQYTGRAAVSVSRRDVADLEIQLAANFELPVAVDSGDATPPADWPIGLMLMPLDGGPVAFGDRKPGGGIMIDRVYPGRYRLIVDLLPPGFYVSSMEFAERDVLGQPMNIVPGSALRLILKNKAGVVRGVIENARPAVVLLLPSANSEAEFVRRVDCAAGATFQFESLRPGEYSVIAFDRVEDAKLSDRSFIANLSTGSQSVSVKEGSNESVELSVHRWPD